MSYVYDYDPIEARRLREQDKPSLADCHDFGGLLHPKDEAWLKTVLRTHARTGRVPTDPKD